MKLDSLGFSEFDVFAFCLFYVRPCFNPSVLIACKSLFIASLSSDMHMVSSAYKMLSVSIPVTLCSLSFNLSFVCMSLGSHVINTMKRYGDSGHPCLIPVSCRTQADSYPSISTLNDGFAYRASTAFTDYSGTFILLSAIMASLCFMLSSDLSQSSKANRVFVCVFSPLFHHSLYVVYGLRRAFLASASILCCL